MNHINKIKKINNFFNYLDSLDKINIKDISKMFIYKEIIDIINIDFLNFDQINNALNKETIINLLNNKNYEEVLDKILLNEYAFVFCKIMNEKYEPKKYWSLIICFNSFRMSFNDTYCWCYLPNKKHIDLLKIIISHRRILEVGSGNGLLSAILKSAGFNIKATDPMYEYKKYENFLHIERLTCKEAIKKYDYYECLLMAWGRGYFDEESYKNFKGDMIILIGEENGGCTSNGYLDDIDDWNDWKLIEKIHHHQFEFYTDSIKIYQRIY